MARRPYVADREPERRDIGDEIRERLVDAVGLVGEAVHERDELRAEVPAAPTPIGRIIIDEAVAPRLGSVFTVFDGSYG